MTREFISALASSAAGYCKDNECQRCPMEGVCYATFGSMIPDVEDWEQLIRQKMNEEYDDTEE